MSARTTPLFKLAKELGVPNKELMAFLKERNLPAKRAIDTLTVGQVTIILEKYRGATVGATAPGTAAALAAPPATPPPAPAAAPVTPPARSPVPAVGAVTPPPTEPAPPPAPARTDTQPPPPTPQPSAPPPPAPAPYVPVRRGYVYRGPVTLSDLARAMDLRASDIIKNLLAEKQMVTLNQRLGEDIVKLIGERFDFPVTNPAAPAASTATRAASGGTTNLKPRAPVVTIMGHVDHGKTSLLDAIRETNVAAGEAGGITQHLSAFRVGLAGKGDVVFLDTPGHEAFTALRARGAKVTDIVVLVVAADDGVMPQTIEAIDHAKAAGVPIVVAINKMDKPGANPARVKQELASRDLAPEEWGGKTIMIEVSALKKTGLDKLLEMLLLEAELLELKADPTGPAQGTVLEGRMHKSRGPIANLLVERGTLKVGDIVTAGGAYGRVRMMLSDKGANLTEAGPAVPVELLGLSQVPEAGAHLMVMVDERSAREATERHLSRLKEERLTRRHITLQDVSAGVAAGEAKELRIILKADVQGSLEALASALARLANDQVKLAVIHQGVGPISLSDVALAAASNAVIFGFHIGAEPQAEEHARQEEVEIRLYSIIYEAVDEVRKAMEGLLAPRVEEVALGRAEVRATFRTPKGTVAGCFITTGKAVRGDKIRVLRGGKVVHETNLTSLRRFKDDVKEVAAGYECGIFVESFDLFAVGDLLEFYTQTLVQEKLRI